MPKIQYYSGPTWGWQPFYTLGDIQFQCSPAIATSINVKGVNDYGELRSDPSDPMTASDWSRLHWWKYVTQPPDHGICGSTITYVGLVGEGSLPEYLNEDYSWYCMTLDGTPPEPPCDDIQATHYQIRLEYEGVASFSDATENTYQLMPIQPLPVDNSYQVAMDSNRPYYYLRIRFCDASGNIKPYTGSFGVTGASDNAGINMFVQTGSLTNSGSWLSGRIQSFANTDGWYQHSYKIDYLDSSAVIKDPDCAEDPLPLPEDPQPIPPTELPLPEFPPEIEPEDPVEPETPTTPLPPSPPAPEAGCECQEYIAESIQDLTRVLSLELGKLRTDLVKSINALNVQLVSIDETNNKVLKWSIDTLYPELQKLVRAMYTIPGIKPEMSISQVLDQINDNVNEFVVQYEPVNIENEYRTVSHRIIDDLDSTLSKL